MFGAGDCIPVERIPKTSTILEVNKPSFIYVLLVCRAFVDLNSENCVNFRPYTSLAKCYFIPYHFAFSKTSTNPPPQKKKNKQNKNKNKNKKTATSCDVFLLVLIVWFYCALLVPAGSM